MGNQFNHIVAGTIMAGAFYLGGHGLGAAWAVFLGNLFPDLDHAFVEKGRSWVTHTGTAPALLGWLVGVLPGVFGWVAPLVPFFVAGMVVHLIVDFNHHGSRREIWIPFVSDVFGDAIPWWMTIVFSILTLLPFVAGLPALPF
jgi:hypothetical protein